MKKWLWKLLRFFDPLQPVLYDPRTNCFIKIKGTQDNGILCSTFCSEYGIAIGTSGRQLLSYDYVWSCVRVGAIDKFSKAYLKSVEDGGKWKIKGSI